MPVLENPYANAYSPIGASIAQFSRAFIPRKTPEERELARLHGEYYQAETDRARADAEKAARASSAADVFRSAIQRGFGPLAEQPRPDDQFVGPMPTMSRDEQVRGAMPDVMSSLTDMGHPQSIGETVLALMANAPGSSDAATMRSFIGAGHGANKESAFSPEGAAANAARDQAGAEQIANIHESGANRRAEMADDRSTLVVPDPNSPTGFTVQTKKAAIGGPAVPPAAHEGLSPIAKLVRERDALPPGSPNRDIYDAAIRKETTLASDHAKPIPANIQTGMISNMNAVRQIDKALAALDEHPDAVGAKGYVPDMILQRTDPQGVATRALISDIGSLKLHERSGAAVTASEFPRLRPFIPTTTDDAATIRQKLKNFRNEYMNVLADQDSAFGDQAGYTPNAPVREFLKTGKLSDNRALADEAYAAIQKGADAAAVKKRYKEQTGEDLPEQP
jgi:hypothetical protein